MEVRKVKVHTCFDKENENPLSPVKCRCRQYMSASEASILVSRGNYQYVQIGKKELKTVEVCPTCSNDENLKKYCTGCGKTGSVEVVREYPVYGEDIIFVSSDGKKNPKTTQVKKSPTIEKAHIERAWLSNNVPEQARIEAYGGTILEALAGLGAEIRDSKTGEIISKGRPEPEDNLEAGTGRRYDYGRSV
jgi:hypothetical protein